MASTLYKSKAQSPLNHGVNLVLNTFCIRKTSRDRPGMGEAILMIWLTLPRSEQRSRPRIGPIRRHRKIALKQKDEKIIWSEKIEKKVLPTDYLTYWNVSFSSDRQTQKP